MRDLMFMLAPVALILYFVVSTRTIFIVRRVGGAASPLDHATLATLGLADC